MKTMRRKSRSINQSDMKNICDGLCDNMDLVLEYFGLEASISEKMVTMSCPIHGGDNQTALNLYHTGDFYRGNWVCRTHHCEKIFQPSFIGFIRGILSAREHNWTKEGDDVYPFNKTVDLALKILKKQLTDISSHNQHYVEKNRFTKTISSLYAKNTTTAKPTRKHVTSTLAIPALYYVNRGFSVEILKKYDVGLCTNPDKPMFNRAVVPVYDVEYKTLVGCTGRSIFDQCSKCQCYHSPDDNCIDPINSWKYPKWKHNKNFKSKDHLYNMWFAQKDIQKTTNIILVESPGNVWKFAEHGINNVVALFGNSMSDRQKMIMDGSGAMNIFLALDNDVAGAQGSESIRKKCHKTYNTYTIDIPKNDIAELTSEQMQDIIGKYNLS